jgi:hypothetical protein
LPRPKPKSKVVLSSVVYPCCGVSLWGRTTEPCWMCGELTGFDAWAGRNGVAQSYWAYAARRAESNTNVQVWRNGPEEGQTVY